MIKKAIIIASISLTGLFFAVTFFSNTYAVTAADWKAGKIIDDFIFTDKSSMSVAQIQTFLNNKVGTGTNGVPGQCDTNGTRMSEWSNYSITRAQYGINVGKPGPFTCLKDYYEVPKTEPGPGIPANNYGSKPIPAGAKSAAQLIWDAAQQYNINPKVLLVKLGTESLGPLTSDDWPFLSQYTYAMGSHCPDSGPNGTANCDSDYAGFSIQMSSAASLLRWYLDNMTQSWWSYKKPYKTNYILWNVTQSGCGGANVYIENKATAALYTYTPYQPNAAALNNMYGTGNGCSAYGNRNFWRVFNDWFGSTIVNEYVASNTSLKPTDSKYCSRLKSTDSTLNSFCYSPLTGDFNGDGYQDIAVVYTYPDKATFNLWLFPGTASGIGDPVIQRQYPASEYWNISKTKFASGDVNGDGIDDLVALTRSIYGGITTLEIFGSKSTALTQLPKITYNPKIYKSLETGWYWEGVDVVRTLGDYNGDGYEDLAVTYTYPDKATFNLWLFPGTASGIGDPVIQRQYLAKDYWNISNDKLVSGDINGDNIDDLISFTRSIYGGITTLEIFGSKSTALTQLPKITYNPKIYKSLETGWYWEGVDPIRQVIDYNNDGIKDIAIIYTYPDKATFNLWLFPGTASGIGDPVIQRQYPASEGWKAGGDRFVGIDTNQDNIGDLLSLSYNQYGGITILSIMGDVTYKLGQQATITNKDSIYKAVYTGWYWNNLQ